MDLKHRFYLVIPFVFLIFLWMEAPVYSEITSTVTGKVIDEETGIGIKDVEIAIWNTIRSEAPQLSYRAVTDSNGKFTILDVFPSIYKIGFFPPPPYAWARKYENQFIFDTITVPKGKNVTIFKKLKIGGVIEIRTFDLHANKPIADVWITLHDVDRRLLREKGILTNSQGKYIVDCMDEGSYTVDARCEGYGMKRIEFEIRLKETTHVEIPFDSKSPTGVNGYIKCDENGAPLKDIGVSVHREDQYGWVHCYTDENGFYSTVDLEPGEYTINIVGLGPKDADGEDNPIFISKPVKILKGKKMIVNFDVDCSIEYEKREDE